jgi:hypothetical protein
VVGGDDGPRLHLEVITSVKCNADLVLPGPCSLATGDAVGDRSGEERRHRFELVIALV